MKFHSFTVALLCAMLAFVSCGSDDGSPSADEILSEETTPIDFNYEGYFDYHNYDDEYVLFDYAGREYVGSDTVASQKCTLDLRQGKHHLLWVKGIDCEKQRTVYSIEGELKNQSVHYDPQSKVVFTNNQDCSIPSVSFFEKDIEVTPYLMPVQQIEFGNFLTCNIEIEITDMKENLKQPELEEQTPHFFHWVRQEVGRITGLPFVNSVALTSSNYTTSDGGIDLYVYTAAEDPYTNRPKDAPNKTIIKVGSFGMLCPLGGISNIQLDTEVGDVNGNPVKTTTLPRISLRRGYTTILRGPLFSGTTSDWAVTWEPY